MINNASVVPQQPQYDPSVLQGLGMQAPPRDSIGVLRALLPLLQQYPDLIHYVTALMQHPQEFVATHPELGPQPTSSIAPTPGNSLVQPQPGSQPGSPVVGQRVQPMDQGAGQAPQGVPNTDPGMPGTPTTMDKGKNFMESEPNDVTPRQTQMTGPTKAALAPPTSYKGMPADARVTVVGGTPIKLADGMTEDKFRKGLGI